jgi:hypothetical protein
MSDGFYSRYLETSIYQTSATGYDSTVFLYNTPNSKNAGLVQLLATNQYNATVYAQVFSAPFPTGVAGVSGLQQVATGVATGTGNYTGVPTFMAPNIVIGQTPLAVLAVPTGPSQAKLDLNTAHWIKAPSGMTIAASSNPVSYQPINTGCLNYTIFYNKP